MRLPSVKTLQIVFGDKAKEARAILETKNTLTINTPAVESLRRQSFGRHPKYYIKLTALNELAELHGIEAAESVNGEFAEYINTGYSYYPTVIYWRGNYRVQSIGDFIETMERQRVYFK